MKLSHSNKIVELRKSLGISQLELGKRVGASAMAVSRWERQEQQPSGNLLIKLGVLAQGDAELCWSFWNMAGLNSDDVVRVLPIAEKRFRRAVPVLQIVKAGARHLPTNEDLVAIPFLSVIAAAGKGQGSSVNDLSWAKSRQIIAAPKLWCPNPTHTVCMRVQGNSMEPVLLDGYIIVVDQKQTDKKKLSGHMVVAHHDKYGLVVSRYWQLKDSPTLISDNRSHEPVPLTSAWRIVGKVLWWIGESQK